MKNNRLRAVDSAALGPAAAVPEQDPHPTPAQVLVLDSLRQLAHPATLAELAEATALHVNTLRGHLTLLIADGLVQRTTLAPTGRGRPAAAFELCSRPGAARTREYVGLATTLASALRRLSPQPTIDAVDAGRSWGRMLASQTLATSAQTPLQRRRALIGILEALRFAPEGDAKARTVRLTRCPLLEAAHEHPDIVCSIHGGVVEGALEAWGDSDTGVDLQAFAEPGACILRMTPKQGRGHEHA